MENIVLGQEFIPRFDENETLHLENRSLWDEFKRVSDLVKPYVALSWGFPRNVQAFYEQYVSLEEKVTELERVSPNIHMVPEVEVDKVKNELVVLDIEKSILESKLTGYRGVEEDIDMLKATLVSLELEKTGFLDKRGDLNASTLKNKYLQENVAGLDIHVRKLNEDMLWVFIGWDDQGVG